MGKKQKKKKEKSSMFYTKKKKKERPQTGKKDFARREGRGDDNDEKRLCHPLLVGFFHPSAKHNKMKRGYNHLFFCSTTS
jgi:hypothetical protein